MQRLGRTEYVHVIHTVRKPITPTFQQAYFFQNPSTNWGVTDQVMRNNVFSIKLFKALTDFGE
jgi:hypothetical protein